MKISQDKPVSARPLRPDLHDVVVGSVFCLVSALIIYIGGGIPYIMDGNETFSSILHARNFLTFDLGTSFGLADESTSPIAQGHAVVHTHQGNFPRIYAAILYVMGVQSVAGQIIATTYTVGLGSVLLLNRVLRRYYGDGLAMVVMLLLLTDYILFAQWQVVTYRVWHLAFLSLALFSVSRYLVTHKRKYLLAVLLVWWGLYYYELVFAVFLSVSVGTWALWNARRSIFDAVTCMAVALLGALLGVATVISQLIGYLGWDGFKQDLSMTYWARNKVAESGDLIAMLRTFYEDNNVAFFYNLMDGSMYRNVQSFVDAYFKWGLQTSTPALTFSILIVLLGVVLRAQFNVNGRVRAPSVTIALMSILFLLHWAVPGSLYMLIITAVLLVGYRFVGQARGGALQMTDRAFAQTVLWGQASVLLSALVLDGRVLGLRPVMADLSPAGVAVAVVGLLAAGWGWTQFVLRHIERNGGQVALVSVLRVSLFWLVLLVLMGYQHRLYDQSQSKIWLDVLYGGVAGQWVIKAGIALIVLTITGWLLPATHKALLTPSQQDAGGRGVREMGVLLGCTMIGLATALIVFPGYIFSGYLFRFAPFLFFSIALILAMGMFVLGHDAVRRLAAWQKEPRSDTVMAVVSVAFVAVFWGSVQIGNATLFPADDFSVIRRVEALKADNPTIASNSYAVPFSVVTGNWGYLDHALGEGKVLLTTDGYDMLRDDRYWWFADRKTNPDYNRPSHFVCYIPQTFWTASIDHAVKAPWCSNIGLMRLASEKPDNVWPDHKVIATDPGGSDRWAIIEMDWDFSPYIPSPPEVSLEGDGALRALMVSYLYRQQAQKAELRSVVNLYAVKQDGRYCEVVRQLEPQATGHDGKARLNLTGGEGERLIVGVRPMTQTRTGLDFFSKSFVFNASGVHSAQNCMYIKLLDGRLVDQTWQKINGDDK